jgi:hypothetical protein
MLGQRWNYQLTEQECDDTLLGQVYAVINLYAAMWNDE